MATVSQLSRGGVNAIGGHNASSTGDAPAMVATVGTDTTPSITETYVARVFLPTNATVTGVAILNGSLVAGNVMAILYNAAGVPVAQSASTAQAGAAGYQQIAFTAPFAAQGPGRYFIGVQCNNVGARLRTHAVGVFPAFKKTGETFGTATALTTVSTFTTAVGPIASTY